MVPCEKEIVHSVYDLAEDGDLAWFSGVGASGVCGKMDKRVKVVNRNPGIELFRVLLMFGICWLHAITRGEYCVTPVNGRSGIFSEIIGS